MDRYKKGNKRGDWTSTGEIVRDRLSSGRKILYVICECKCGNKKRVQGQHLNSGSSKNCGCYNAKRFGEFARQQKIHGMEGTVFYRKYGSLKTRCNNKNSDSYYRYGGRGIKCLRNTFKDFMDDMYESYLDHCEKYGASNTTIERINNDGHYCKSNCKRATNKEQQNNKSSNHLITYNGKTQNIQQWTKEYGFKTTLITDRLKRGRDIKDIFTKKVETKFSNKK